MFTTLKRSLFSLPFLIITLFSFAAEKTVTVEICRLPVDVVLNTESKTAVIEDNRVWYDVKENYSNIDLVIPENIIYEGVTYQLTEIKEKAFYFCPCIVSVTLPSCNIIYGPRIFASCKNLVTVNLGNNIDNIPQNFFSGCSSIKELVLPTSITKIGADAFNNCTNLEKLIIPASVTTVDGSIWDKLDNIKEFYIGCPNPEIFQKESFYTNSTKHQNVDVKVYVPEQSLEAYKSYFNIPSGQPNPFYAMPEVEPEPEPVTPTLTLDRETVEMNVGDEMQLTATLQPEPTDEVTISWQSEDESIAKVVDGNIIAIGLGKTIVKASVGELVAECQVNVVPIKLEDFTITGIDPLGVFFIGRTYQAGVVLRPENVTDKTVVWSCDKPELATITEDGFITCKAEGEATITAKAGGISHSIVLRIKPVELLSITLSPEIMELTVGQEGELTWTFSPSDATHTDIEWRNYDDAIVSVTGNVVKAISAGETYIKAFNLKNGVWSNECKVIVKRAKSDVLVLSVSNITMTAKETYQLKVLNDIEDLEDPIVWSSADRSVATVDENGLITAVGKGETVITAASGERKGECVVTVNIIEVTEILMSQTEIEMHPGDIYELEAVVNPEDATDKTIVWESDNEDVATVNNGVVEAKGEGSAKITARCGALSVSCTVNVTIEKIDIESVTINETEVEMEPGQTRQLIFTVNPEDAWFENVEWKSSNDKVATVDNNGVVTAVAAGEAFVSIGVDAVAAVCKVKVVNPAVLGGIDEINQDNSFGLTTISNSIIISGIGRGDAVAVYSISGTTIFSNSNVTSGDITVKVPVSGIYIVRVNNLAKKVAVRM